jgi:hypothetical protein
MRYFSGTLIAAISDRKVIVLAHLSKTPELALFFNSALFNMAQILP